MTELRHDARFIPKHGPELLVDGERWQDPLDGDIPPVGSGREEHLRHSPHPEALPEHIAPDHVGVDGARH